MSACKLGCLQTWLQTCLQGVPDVVLRKTSDHSIVFNLEDNVSVTENYLASEGVAEVVAAILTGEDAGLGLPRGEERLWRSLYNGQLDTKGRRTC